MWTAVRTGLVGARRARSRARLVSVRGMSSTANEVSEQRSRLGRVWHGCCASGGMKGATRRATSGEARTDGPQRAARAVRVGGFHCVGRVCVPVREPSVSEAAGRVQGSWHSHGRHTESPTEKLPGTLFLSPLERVVHVTETRHFRSGDVHSGLHGHRGRPLRDESDPVDTSVLTVL